MVHNLDKVLVEVVVLRPLRVTKDGAQVVELLNLGLGICL